MKSWLSKRWAPYIFLAFVAAITLLPGNASLPLIDRDEPRFAQATREMIQRHEWIIPYFNGVYRFDKPVMIYWLMRGCYALFGVNEFAARLSSVIFSWLTACVIFELARRFARRDISILAGVMWLTCLQVLIHGRLAVADMPMVFSVALAHLALYELLFCETNTRIWFWTLYTALAFGFLTKGPIALLCPVLTLLFLRFVFWRQPLHWKKLNPLMGLPFCLILIALWGIPALIETHGLFWKVGMDEHVVQRGLESFNNRFVLPFYYIPTAFLSLFPWIAFLGWAIAAAQKNWSRDYAFLLSWATGPYLIFSLYATQLPHYVMPAFPALCILLAQGAAFSFENKSRSKNFAIVLGIWTLLAFALIWIAWKAPFSASADHLRWALLAIILAVFCLIKLALLARFQKWDWMIVSVLVLGFAFSEIGYQLHYLSPAVRLSPLLQKMPANTDFIFSGFEEPSLVFYSDRRWRSESLQNPEWVKASGPRMIVWLKSESRLDRCIKSMFSKSAPDPRIESSVPNQEQTDFLNSNGYLFVNLSGINFARASWVELEAAFKMN